MRVQRSRSTYAATCKHRQELARSTLDEMAGSDRQDAGKPVYRTTGGAGVERASYGPLGGGHEGPGGKTFHSTGGAGVMGSYGPPVPLGGRGDHEESLRIKREAWGGGDAAAARREDADTGGGGNGGRPYADAESTIAGPGSDIAARGVMLGSADEGATPTAQADSSARPQTAPEETAGRHARHHHHHHHYTRIGPAR